MTRTVFHGGTVFDGTGAPAVQGDVLVEDGKIVDVGPQLDGDEGVDMSGKWVLPGFFDCHTHVMFGPHLLNTDLFLDTPFSMRFYEAVDNLEATLRQGITTVRDAAGADLGSEDRGRARPHPRTADADLDFDAEPDRGPRRRLDAVAVPTSRWAPHYPGLPSRWLTAPTRCAGRSVSSSVPAPT